MTLFEQYYNADYERSRDALIPKAVTKANRNFGSCCKVKGNNKISLKWAAGWNKSYAREMERLVAEAGIKN